MAAEPVEIPLVADDKASAKIQDVEKNLDSLAGAATAAASSLSATFASVAGGVAVGTLLADGIKAVAGFLYEGATAALAFGDEMKKMELRTGETSQALQELRFGAEQSGLGLETLLTGTKKLEASLASGNAKAIASFNELGAKGGEGVQKIIERLADVEDANKRASIAVDLFGSKTGVAISRAADDFATAATAARNFGIIVSDDIVAAGDKADDKLDLIGQQLETMAIKIGGAILQSGAFQTALDLVAEGLAQVLGWIDANSEAITDFTDMVIILAADGFGTLVSGIGFVIDAYSGLRVLWEEATQQATEFLIKVNALGEALSNPIDAAATFQRYQDAIAASRAEHERSVQAILEQNETWHGSLDKVVKGVQGLSARLVEGAATQRVHAESVRAGITPMEDQGQAAKKLAENLKKLHDEVAKEQDALMAAKAKEAEAAIQALATSFDKTHESVQKLAIATDIAGSELRNLGDERLNELLDELAKSMEHADEEALALGEVVRDKLTHYLTDFGQEARAAKEALTPFDKAVQDAAKGIIGMQTAINQGDVAAKLLEMGFSAKEIAEQLGTAEKSTFDFNDALAAANDAMQLLGVGSDSFVSQFLGGIGAIGSSLQNVFSKGGLLDSLKGGTGIIDKLLPAAGIAGAAVSVGITLVKTFKALFGKSDQQKVMESVGKGWGVSISKGLADQIVKTSKDLNISRDLAASLNIGAIIAESGQDARAFGAQINELMGSIASGAVPAVEGMQALDDSFLKVTESAAKLGIVGDKTTRDTIARAKELGTLTEGMKDFLDAQAQLAAQGAAGLVGLDFTGASEEQGAAAASNFLLAFNTAIEQQGLIGATDAFRDSFGALKEELTESFGEDFANQVLSPIAGLFDLTSPDSPFRGAAVAGQALADVTTAAANSNKLTAESFNALGISAKQAYDQAIAGGATAAQAQEAILPFLRAAVSASEEYGITLDANTQALVDQAKASGVAFPEDPILRSAKAMETVAVALDKVFNLGLAAAGAFDHMATSASGAASAASNIPNNVPNPGGGAIPTGPPLAEGGYVPATPGGQLRMIGEGGEGEYVIPESKLGRFGFNMPITINGSGLSEQELVRAISTATGPVRREIQLVMSGLRG